MQIKETAMFGCAREKLWEYIEQPEKQKLWMKGLLSNERTSVGREGKGSTFQMKIQEGGKVAVYEGEVLEQDRPRRLEVRFWGGSFPKGMFMRVEYVLTEQSEGQTRLDYTATLEGQRPGWLMRLMLPVLKLFGRMQLRSFLRSLRQQVEGPAQAA